MRSGPEQPRRSAPVASGDNIGAILKNSPLNGLETRILLTHALELSRVELITRSERMLTADEAQRLSVLFQRRIDGEPIAYIVGEREFYGLSFHVTPDVLIPRPETELLVELAIERLPQNGRILDLGTGSGAIAVAIAHARPNATVMAVDISEPALSIARHNATRHGAQVIFLHSDWYSTLAGRQFDIIVANPPYIVAGDTHLSQGDLRFEPAGALTDYADGLSALRKIIIDAPRHLAPGGWLLMEHGYDQSPAVRGLLAAQGFCNTQSWRDLAGIERATGGTRQSKLAR
jgi:release factor glutamine methyltransferase